MRYRFAALILALLAVPAVVPAVAHAQDAVSWDVLSRVKLVKGDGGVLTPSFEADIEQLRGTQIQLKGFMLPLDQAAEQQHFILSANPVQNCFFCMPGGPESLVEVKTTKPVAFSYDPVEISGTLELLSDDPMGMYYRLSSAQVVR